MGEGSEGFGREGGLINIMVSALTRLQLASCTAFFLLSLTVGQASAALQCEMNGKQINPNNGSDLVGLTGLMRCIESDTGKMRREQELRGGKFVGLDRLFDREGRLQRERSVNESGNNEGRVREFWPSGQVRRESNETNSRTQGAVRSFYENGQLERVSFTEGSRVQASLNYNKEGGLTDISCHTSSVLHEDRIPCGFAGKVRTVTVNSGRASSQPSTATTYEQGKMLAVTTYRADGNIWAELELQNGVRWHRVFDARGAKDGKNVLREERLFEADSENTRRVSDNTGRLQWSKLWGSNEQLIEHNRFSNGRAVLSERWYLNGSLKEKISATYEGAPARGEGAQALSQRESYNDEGRLSSRENFMASDNAFAPRTGIQQIYHANGKLAVEETYSAPDERGRTKLTARKQFDESGKLTADDEILEDGSRKRR